MTAALVTPERFQWELEDGWDEGREEALTRWSRTHITEGVCPGCCCGQPFTCARCGGRVHSEVVNVYDVDGNEEIGHAFYCQKERRADGQPTNVREAAERP